jgi:hypothetical protein
MAAPNPNPNPSTITPLKAIGNIRRPELQQIAPIGYDKININKPYDKNHPYIYSEGINGDNHGKEPATPPQTPQDAFYSVGSKDDIKGRIGSSSPGTLAQNQYRAGKEYTANW